MLDIKLIRDNQEQFKKQFEKRGVIHLFNQVIENDSKIRALKYNTEEKRKEQNQFSKHITNKELSVEQKQQFIEKSRVLSDIITKEKEKLALYQEQHQQLLATIPNMLSDEVPYGKDEADNSVVYTYGEKPRFSFSPKAHEEIATELQLIDFVRGTKIAGSRFAFLKGKGALLERALANFMLDTHIQEHCYQEIAPPLLVNQHTLYGTGQLPKFSEDLFQTKDGFYLIPTAEVPVTNIFANEILDAENMPYKFVAFTPCFRREAGSYGKDTKGYLRQHQFYKVELVWITEPQESEQAHQKLVKHAQTILEKLKLPYQTVLLCSDDTGFSAQKCYDLEVWLPSQNKYREISSCSNCGDFQARRINMRIAIKNQKNVIPHTLNGSGLAIGRTLIAVLENYQRQDGTVDIPEVLVSYMGGLTRLE